MSCQGDQRKFLKFLAKKIFFFKIAQNDEKIIFEKIWRIKFFFDTKIPLVPPWQSKKNFSTKKFFSFKIVPKAFLCRFKQT